MNNDSIKKIDSNLDDLFTVADCYLGADPAARLKDEYEEKKNESLLQVMLFGSYNAGKSSLINALLMEEVAATGDIPKTAFADKYYWNGCYLMDTPGVNAPIEHEAVTQEQIDRSELILFVIRQGDQDVKDVYERMFTMLGRDKQVFVVFNHELDQAELPTALNRLTGIMAEYADSHNIELQRVAEIPVIPVNIKTAMKARIKGSDALAEHSGIAHFEAVFHSWLRQFDSEHYYLDRLRKYIHQCVVNPLRSSIREEAGGEQDGKLEELQYQRDEVIRQYGILGSQVANHVNSEMVRAKPQIATILGEAGSQFELESRMLELSESIVNSTSEFLGQRCDNIVSELNANVSVSIQAADTNERSRLGETVETLAVEGAKRVDKGVIKDGLLFLRKMKIPGIKGRWGKTLDKWAGRAVLAVTAAVSAFEIYSASADQDKENNEIRKQTLGVHQLVESAASDIRSAIIEESRSLISEAMDKALAEIDANILEITTISEKYVADLDKVNVLAGTLDSIQI